MKVTIYDCGVITKNSCQLPKVVDVIFAETPKDALKYFLDKNKKEVKKEGEALDGIYSDSCVAVNGQTFYTKLELAKDKFYSRLLCMITSGQLQIKLTDVPLAPIILEFNN